MSNFNKKQKLPPIAYIFFATLIVILLKIFLPQTSACDLKTKDNLSCGEESIFNNPNTLKQEGIEAYRQKDFNLAAIKFDQDFKQNQDPESFLYYNNSIAKQSNQNQVFTIAVVIPLNNDTKSLSKTMLKATAQYQSEYNQNNSQKMVILIANDGNDIDVNQQAQKVAKALVAKKDNLVAVIGHYASRVSITVKPIYDQKLVFLSAHTTSSALINQGKDTFFFRVTNTTQAQAVKLIDYLKQQGHKKIAVFVSPRAFSASFYDDFTAKWRELGNEYQIVKQSKLENNPSILNDVTEAQNKGATAMVVCPDVNPQEGNQKDNTDILLSNSNQLLIGGCNTLNALFYTEEITQGIEQGTLNLVVTSPLYPNLEVQDKYKQLWGSYQGVDLTRYALSYDAVKTVADAVLELKNQNKKVNTIELQKILANNFKTKSITGEPITLRGSERVENTAAIVTPCQANANCDWQKIQ